MFCEFKFDMKKRNDCYLIVNEIQSAKQRKKNSLYILLADPVSQKIFLISDREPRE